MSLSEFEIAVGGITSIPITSSLFLLAYKTFGEQRLDSSNLKPKKVSAKPTQATKQQNKDTKEWTVAQQLNKQTINPTNVKNYCCIARNNASYFLRAKSGTTIFA